jgi:siderophore synthetase component
MKLHPLSLTDSNFMTLIPTRPEEEMTSSELVILNLLNCYCREIGSPQQQLSIHHANDISDCPKILRNFVATAGAKILKFCLSHSEIEVLAATQAEISALGTYHYLGMAFFRKNSSDWLRLTGMAFAEMMDLELSAHYKKPKEPDFLIQLQDSYRVSDLLVQAPTKQFCELPSFVESEQSLIYGHPFHPSPKSRLGLSVEDVKKFSPEFGTRFQLHYFGVHEDFLIQESLENKPAGNLLDLGRISSNLPSSFVPIPVHPWQARHLLKMPEIESALSQGQLLDLGLQGNSYFPTSSVRTVFSPESPYFLKLSLHVRITNCIRRNAIHELQSSIEMTRIMRSVQQTYIERYPHFCALEEPAYMTVDLASPYSDCRQRITESFGLAFRRGFDQSLQPEVTPILAAALFGNREIGRRWIRNLIPNDVTSEEWFEIYVEKLLPPLLDLFFKDGIMFEPHLQNTLIGFKNGIPTQVWVRDFDNARLVAGSPSAELLMRSRPILQKDVIYFEPQAWNRFVYCLIVNHLGEAIEQLSFSCPSKENGFWRILRHRFQQYSLSIQNKHCKDQIALLLENQSLPAKCNLITRFRRTPDCNADYIEIPNPLKL